MIYCLSCEKYPRDTKVIPYGSSFPINTFKVRLLSESVPNPMPTSGADVEGLADSTMFAVGSILYVRDDGNGVSKEYVYGDNGFQLWSGATSGGATGLVIDSDGSVYIG